MFSDKRPLGLKIVVYLAILNSVATITHFILLDRGILKSSGLIADFWIYAGTVAIVAVLPLVIGAYGMYGKRMWGLGFFTLGSGAYLCAAVLILLLSVKASSYGIMFYSSIYLIFYSLLATLYSWAFRHHLREF